MEEGGVMRQWKEEAEVEVEEEEEEEEEEVGLIRRPAHVQVTTVTTTSTIDIQGQEICETKEYSSEIEKIITPPSSDPIPIISGDTTSLTDVTIQSERVGIITENVQLVKELYLESLYQKPPTQGFYCPNCKTCIQKVLILETVREGETSVPPPPPPPYPPPPTPPQPLPSYDRFRCATCFSFLIPIGSWLFPGLAGDKEVSAPEDQVIEIPPEEKDQDEPRTKPSRWGVLASASKIAIQKKPKEEEKPSPEEEAEVEVGTDQVIEIPPEEKAQDEPRTKPSRWGVLASASKIAIQKKPKEEEKPSPEEEAEVEVGTEQPASPTIVKEPESTKTWEILKSIVYGGLIESIASLSIVTSSASADASTLSILALSLANLIGGLFVLVHHIWDLKSEQQSTDDQTVELVDRYNQTLGKRENFFLHVCIAILSFLIFGLVPPLVYGLTIYETNSKVLTLVAVAGASAICIILLSIAKEYIQRPNTYLTYLKTVVYYLCTGALASVISYIAGVLIRELLEKLGWFGYESSGFDLMLPEMSIGKPRFGPY